MFELRRLWQQELSLLFSTQIAGLWVHPSRTSTRVPRSSGGSNASGQPCDMAREVNTPEIQLLQKQMANNVYWLFEEQQKERTEAEREDFRERVEKCAKCVDQWTKMIPEALNRVPD